MITGRTSGQQHKNSASFASTDTGAGVYASIPLQSFRLSLGADTSWHTIETERTVIGATQSGSFLANTSHAYVVLSTDIALGPNFALTPFIGVTYQRLLTPEFKENGKLAALSIKGDTTEKLQPDFGLRLRSHWEQSSGVKLDFDAALRVEQDNNNQPQRTHAFASGPEFNVQGLSASTQRVSWETGLSFEFNDTAQLRAHYQGSTTPRSTAHAFRLGISGRF